MSKTTYYVEAHRKGKYNPTGQTVWNAFEGYNVKGDTTRKFKKMYPNYVIDKILKN